MEIKSVMLLPRTEDLDPEEDGGDPRAELIRQLLEYKKFKDAANLLSDSAEIRKERFTRPDSVIADLKSQSEPELDLEQISLWDLIEAFDHIMQSIGDMPSYDHIKDDTPTDMYQIEILHRLQKEGAMTFEDIFKDRANRLVMLGLFLAMLELMRNDLIWAEQSETLGTITVRALTEKPAEQAVKDAIYANLEEEEQLARARADQEAEKEHVIEETPEPDLERDQEDPDEIEQAAQPSIPIQELPAENDKKINWDTDKSRHALKDPGQISNDLTDHRETSQ